jgi:XTP/dITP diphosphohydrolase
MPDSRLLIATNNAHKVRELRRLLDGAPYDVVTPADLGIALDVVEDGETFQANASLKAHAFAKASGLPSLADDSGIEVDALEGRPGVRSARYGGPGLSDDDRLHHLLDEMGSVPDGIRTARYRVVLVLAHPTGSERSVDGVCEGRIAHAPVGADGFGYDPIFLPRDETASGRTMAELTPIEKDAISHRGRAVRTLLLALDVPGAR